MNDYDGTKAKIEIMQAFVDGKDVEILMHGLGMEDFWLKERLPSWNWDACEYRICPQEMRSMRMPVTMKIQGKTVSIPSLEETWAQLAEERERELVEASLLAEQLRSVIVASADYPLVVSLLRIELTRVLEKIAQFRQLIPDNTEMSERSAASPAAGG